MGQTFLTNIENVLFVFYIFPLIIFHGNFGMLLSTLFCVENS